VAHVDDRWIKATVGPDGKPSREKTSRHGKGLRWRVRYTDPHGTERSKSFARKDDADDFRSTVDADILRGTYIDPDGGKITLRTYGEEWVGQRGGEATTRERIAERARVHIFPALGHYPIGHLAQRPSIIQGWLSNLSRSLSANYTRAVFICLSAMLEAAVTDGLIARNPCKVESVTPPRPPKRVIVPWTPAEVAAVRAGIPGRYRIAADLGAGIGLRQGEAFGLAVNDVDWPRATVVHVRRQVRIVGGRLVFAEPKGRRERNIPLPESVKLRLSAHLAAFPAIPVTLPWLEPGGELRTYDLIITTSTRTALNRAYFGQYIWRPAVEKAGIARTHETGFHALRHHFASVVLASGKVDIRKLAAYLGHASPGFTLSTYTHLIPDGGEGMRQAVDDILAPLPRPEDGPASANGGRNAR
jgi:integrase